MGGHRPASFNLFYDGVFLDFQHFDTKLIAAAQRGKKLWSKNRPKMVFTWVEIAWVDIKSNK